MQRSFSIVHDDDADDDLLDEDTIEPKNEIEKFDLKTDPSGSESEELSSSPKKVPMNLKNKKPEALPRQKLSGGPSSRTAVNSAGISIHSSDSEESDNDSKQKKIPGEYDPKEFENLLVDGDIADVFQYIIKYTPQHMNSEYKFKPFIPEFLPAVGDIDAFLKVVPPETTLSGDIFDENILQLGLLVLDEPASNQSDPALLHLQLRAATDNLVGGNEQKHIVVKKIDNVEKNSKVIDKWIKDISHLHKSKSSSIVRYSQAMPDLDDLMQQWPEEMEQKLKEKGFPKPGEDETLPDYVNTVCNYFEIPVEKNKIQSLHLLCCLYTAIKQTQLYQAQAAANIEKRKQEAEEKKNDTDQLVLD